ASSSGWVMHTHGNECKRRQPGLAATRQRSALSAQGESAPLARRGKLNDPRESPLDPLISNHPKLLPVFFVEVSGAFLVAAHEEIEELFGFVFDQLSVVPLLDQAGIAIVFVAG